jgi:hypothetical protein
MAETDIAITGIDEVEKVGVEDTIKDLAESCATFISKIQDTLTSDIDEDTQKSRCNLAAYDLQSELQGCLDMHWTFQEKLENIEEHQEAEMSEKKSIKQVLIEMAQSFINKRKETDVDTNKEKEYQTRITELETKNAEFAEKERLANELETKKIADAKVAADLLAVEAKKTEVKTFCDETIKAGKMTPAMREIDEPIMFELSKTNIEALKSFQQKYNVPVVPLGETKIENQEDDKRPHIIQQADAYVKAHPKEFSGLSAETAISRALNLQGIGKIKFEDNNKSKGAK